MEYFTKSLEENGESQLIIEIFEELGYEEGKENWKEKLEKESCCFFKR